MHSNPRPHRGRTVAWSDPNADVAAGGLLIGGFRIGGFGLCGIEVSGTGPVASGSVTEGIGIDTRRP